MKNHCTNQSLFTEQSKIKHKRATNFTGTEEIALHKPDVCEAKHAKQKLLNKAKLNTSVQQTLWEPRE